MTYCAVSFEDPKTGEKWDYGEFSLFPSKENAIQEMRFNVGTMQEDHGIWHMNCETGDYIVHFTEMTESEAKQFNLYIPPADTK